MTQPKPAPRPLKKSTSYKFCLVCGRLRSTPIRTAQLCDICMADTASASAALSADVERLTLDSAITTGFTASAVALVSFMALCRQDTDVNKLTWWNHDTVQSELTFRAVRHGL